MAQALNKLSFKIWISLLLFIIANVAIAEECNNFKFMDQTITFKRNTKFGKCSEEITYPKLLSKNDQMLADKMNREVDNFVKSFKFCDSKTKDDQYKTNYEVTKGSDNIISIKWTTKNNDKIVHVDALSLEIDSGEIILVEQIFEPLVKDFIVQIKRISNNYLAKDINYTELLEKVKHREVQYYINNAEWHLIFNSDIDLGREPFIVRIPESLFYKAKP